MDDLSGITIGAFICLPALCLVRICLLPNDWNVWLNITFLFWCQMKESIMNQEKLAKLQAQVRIGGKVSKSTCWLMLLFFLSLVVGLFVHILHLIVVLCRGQPAERRRLCTERQQQMTRSCSSPSRSWESTTSLALRRYSEFILKCTAILGFFMHDTHFTKRDWKNVIVIKLTS